MRLLFISDIHGVKTNLPLIKKRYNELSCDKLIVLGDIYYGYSNSNKLLDYDPLYVKEFLDSFKQNLICIKGNCDTKKDILESSFILGDDVVKIKTTNEELYITHGNIYNESNWDKQNSILIYGHFHIPFIKTTKTNTYISPGSISLPRNNLPTYLFYNEEEFIIYDLNNNVIASKKVAK